MHDPAKLVVVESDARNREVLEALLSRPGLDLFFATSGSEGIALAGRVLPDLVLLGDTLSDRAGVEVCRTLRTMPQLGDVPILLFLASEDRDSRLAGFEAGADDFLAKPYDKVELQTRIRSILRLNRFRQLMNEREKFAQVVNFAPDGLIVCDLEGAVSMANPAMKKLLGWDEIPCDQARFVGDFVPPARRGDFKAWVDSVGGSTSDRMFLDCEFLTRDRKAVPVELSARRFLWSGEPAIQIHVRDVSDTKLLEAKFLRAQRLESIGALAGGIAHDLNNVLTPILASASLLKDDLRDHPARRWIELMETSALRGAGILQQILSFTRGSSEQHEVLRLKYFIEEMSRIVTETFPNGIQFRSAYSPDLSMIRGDPTQIQQVLMNLCVNARDAMPHGGVLRVDIVNQKIDEILATQWPQAKSGSYVRLSVTDTGCGIPPEIRDKIFEPFFTTKPVGKGTGLGLSTVVNIAKNHGGFVTMESEPGRGTSFHVYFPAVEVADAGKDPKRVVVEIPRGNGEQILLAEDDEAISEIIRATLVRAGYRVSVAHDGAEALAIYAREQSRIRLVLADSTMPIVDGFALIRVLQRLNSAARVLVMCDTLTQIRLSELLEDSSVGFLLKPFSAEQLLLSVARELSSGQREPMPRLMPREVSIRDLPASTLGASFATRSGT